MYQQYPGGPGGPGPMDAPPPSTPPQSVLQAVKLMYAGFGASLIGIILSLVSVSSAHSAIAKADPSLTTAQINNAVHLAIGLTIAAGLIGAALWLWMAQKCRAGRGWARVTSTVFFGISTVLTLLGLGGRTSAGLSSFYNILVWLIGLGAIILLWRRTSSEYFNANARRY